MVPAIRRIRVSSRRGRRNGEFGGQLNVLGPGDPAHSDAQQQVTGSLATAGAFYVAVRRVIVAWAIVITNLAGASDGSRPGMHDLKISGLATEWERSEQTGLATIMKGLYGTFRTPTAHAPRISWATSMSDALDMLTLASMLHRRLDKATVRR